MSDCQSAVNASSYRKKRFIYRSFRQQRLVHFHRPKMSSRTVRHSVREKSPSTYRLFVALTDYKITTTLNSFSSQSNAILPSYFSNTASAFFKPMPCYISTSGRQLYFIVAGTALPVLCGLLGIIFCYALASKLLCILSTFTVSSLASGIPLFAFPHASL